MLFLNPWLLAGLAGVAIPIIIHLVRRQAARPIDWGAMRFLMDSLVVRRRKMEWEDLVLMAARCLLLALLALALARPFVPPDSKVPWLFVLPAGLLGVALLGGSFVLSSARLRWWLRIASVGMLLGAAALVVMEKHLNLKRFEASGRRDVALVIDASSSSRLRAGGGTVFEALLDEAREVVKEAPRGTAFAVILGGPAPEALTAAPLTHRADVLGVLDALEPVGGTFRAHEALGAATLALAEGTNASKEIVVFTDVQRHGWRFENPGAWDGLGEVWEEMEPRLLLRRHAVPSSFRNVALSEVDFSREVIGTDREVAIRVTVENSGDEAVTPGAVELEVDGKAVGSEPVGLLVPGQSETVSFRHHFRDAGPAVVRARTEANDDLVVDDRAERVVAVRRTLSVLLVEGNPSGGFFERGAGYASLALAPGAADGGDYLMDPEVVPATRLVPDDLDGRDVVVLADVARLPAATATVLANKVAFGCGLLLITGPRAEKEFFNGWSGPAGSVLPLPLTEEMVEIDGVEPAGATFIHESLNWVTDEGDIHDALIRRWWRTGNPAEGAAQGAALSNGDALIGSRTYGNGRILQVTAAMDARAGNLPAKRSFVPLIHEWVTWAAGIGVDLNVESAWNPAVILGEADGGLTGRYFKRRQKDPSLVRVDSVIDFGWGGGRPHQSLPGDHFSVEWHGWIVAEVSGTHYFEVEVDDGFEMRIGDGGWMRCDGGRHPLGDHVFEADKPVEFEARYIEESGNAHVRLYWTPPGGSMGIVPATVFRPQGGTEGEALAVVDPRGLPREARVRMSGRGLELSINGAAVPGVYEVRAGEAGKDWLPGWEGGTLPVAVISDPEESRFDLMSEDDLAVVSAKIDLVSPSSVADILSVLDGKGFGREIWKLLAVAGFVLFLLETALARWVSRSRRVSEDVRVDLGDHLAGEGGRR
ncbi:MAG: BatA domain-containing protein [Verrucomicrobiota bacterium]